MKCKKCGNEDDFYKSVVGKFTGVSYYPSDDIEDIEITDNEDVTGWVCNNCGCDNGEFEVKM
ncbi:hypothetical protein [Ilyobacter polytropus]|uniref:Uncharacterized protein n=1 Tax=Ilyobacter polytropus (strain ATCC 51220 / DSM 2926 / LMG 16218 / CuHBu1) TaxID=572544 RepID=E3HBD7_ILYPC|nr:hypothetical protein [Ilyobacter polytropus]ADO83752.1 conserved hypothetical protein [Ilyobacter polytropus DSM 2926]